MQHVPLPDKQKKIILINDKVFQRQFIVYKGKIVYCPFLFIIQKNLNKY